MVFLSIVIPVYNAEKYLETCFDSIRMQDFPDYEVIIIDDGSTDGSGALCDRYAQSDSRVRVFHVENGGASRARNLGFAKAGGKYIYCIDNDDCLTDAAYFSAIYSYLSENEVDILQTGARYTSDIPGSSEIVMDYRDLPSFSGAAADPYVDWFVKSQKYESSCWTKIIRTDFLRENSLYFDEGLVVEDFDWNMRFLPLIQSYGVLRTAAYCHVFRQGSITASQGAKQFRLCMDQLETMKRYAAYYKTCGCSETLRRAVLSFIAYQYYITIGHAHTLDKEYSRQLVKHLKDNRYIIDFSQGKRQRALQTIYKLFGFRVLCTAVSYYFNHFRKRTRKK